MKSKPVTITDLARHLGLAIATVSYVLNGRGSEMKIAEATIQRVKKAADELGYQPNFFAHNLRRQRTDTIGVVFADLEENWAHRVLKGMVSVLDPAGYTPLLSVHFWEKEREGKEIQSFLQRKVDALICFPQPTSRDIYKTLITQKKRLILLGDTLLDLPEANYVAWDSGEAAAVVVRHLIAQGFRRIAFIGPDYRTKMTMARYQAYCDCLAAAKLVQKPEWVIWEKPGMVPSEAVMKLLASKKERPDAIFVVNDGLALPLMAAFDRAGINVPGDVAIASMGELSYCGHSSISLTSIVEPCEALGAELARAALKLIESNGAESVQSLIPGINLMSRRSSERLSR